MPPAMPPKERVKTALACAEPDRVPVNYSCNAGIDGRLKQHFGLDAGDEEGLLRALGVDFRRASAPYVGPELHENLPDRQISIWGIRKRWIEHDSGGYWDYCDFPLNGADAETIANWPTPSPDDFDYDTVRSACRRHEGYAITVGGPGLGDVINSTGMIRTMEQTLVDLILRDEAVLGYIDRRIDVLAEVTRREIEAGAGAIDLVWIGEDLGTQQGPMIGLDLYRELIRPRHQRIVDVAKSFDLPVMIHSCGSSSWAFEDFIEMGIDAVDTLQPEAADMAPAYLKERFGGRLAFHGCISTAGPVAYGTPKEVVANVRETLEVMKPGGGYCLAPTHQLQDNSPTGNVVAMYEAAREYGAY